MAKILVVEDDLVLSNKLRDLLQSDRHTVELAPDGKSAHDLLSTFPYDLIILDWQLPDQSGIDLCKQLRSSGKSMPILMLTGKATVMDKETGLDSGVDDYVTKPFEYREISARIRALLRRPEVMHDNVIQFGDLTLDTKAGCVRNNGREIALFPKEFALLEFLMRHPERVFSPEALLDRIWPSDSDSSTNTVRTYMYTLRKKISPKGTPQYIHNVHGIGYKLSAE